MRWLPAVASPYRLFLITFASAPNTLPYLLLYTPAVPGSAGFCSACVCSLVQVYMPAFQAAGLTIDPAAQSFPIDQATSIIEVIFHALYATTKVLLCSAGHFRLLSVATVHTAAEGLSAFFPKLAHRPHLHRFLNYHLSVQKHPNSLFPVAGAAQACTAEYFVPMTSAGVDITALEGLTTCDFSAASVPDCLVAEIAKLAVPSETTVAAQAVRGLGICSSNVFVRFGTGSAVCVRICLQIHLMIHGDCHELPLLDT